MSHARQIIVAWLMSCAVTMPLTAQVVPIPTLYGTGVDDDGTLLPDLAPDPHYTLTASPEGVYPVGPAIAVSDADFPPAWVANSSSSRWINPTGLGADLSDWHPGGVYVYTTTFSLEGFIPATTEILLGWAADDNDLGVAPPPYDYIAVNGFPVFSAGTGGDPGSYTGLHPELLEGTLPWLPGINTLDFVIANTDADPGPGFTGPTGLRVEILSAEALLIPEPTTWMVLAVSLAMAGRRRNRWR